jgi:hypothetical protein
MPEAEWCWSHHPDHAEERRRRASRGGRAGGRGRADNEITEIKALLEDLTNRVLKVEGVEPLETGPAAVANQLINTRLRSIEQERRNRETEDLEERIERLEQEHEREKGARQWRKF